MNTCRSVVKRGGLHRLLASIAVMLALAWLTAGSAEAGQADQAVLITPADGASGVDPGVILTWTSTTNATSYQALIGTAQGLSDVFDSGQIVGLMHPAKNLLSNTTYWVRLVTYANGTSTYTDSTFATGIGTGRLTYPANNATGVGGPAVLFTWSSDPTATAYYPYFGTTLGANDVHNAGSTTHTHVLVGGFQPNREYFVRLWVNRSGSWTYSDTKFSTGVPSGTLTYPLDGATDVDGPVVLFTWSSDPTATAYYPYFGTTLGANDVRNIGSMTGTHVLLGGFQPNTDYYVRLWVNHSGAWTYSDSRFSTGVPGGTLTYPLDGATNVDPTSAHFTWTPATFAQGYCIQVESEPGLADVFYRCPGNVTTETVGNLLPDRTYYVRLYWKINGAYSPAALSSSTFHTGALTIPVDREAFYDQIRSLTRQVREMADIVTNTPVSGSLLEAKTLQRGLTISFCTDYADTLLQLLLDNHIAARTRTIVFDPVETHMVIEYYDPFVDKWATTDPTFGAMYFDDATQTGSSVEELSELVKAKDWAHIPLKWVTPYADSVWQRYYIDPILLYLNPLPLVVTSAPSMVTTDPETVIPSIAIGDTVGIPGDYIFRFSQPADTVTMKAWPTADPEIVGVAEPTTEWALTKQAWPGWSASSFPAGLRVYSLGGSRIFPSATGRITSPADGATDVKPASIAVAWSADSNASGYLVFLGTSPGSNNVLESGTLEASTTSVLSPSLAPSTTYYIRLFVNRSDHWTYTDSQFTTASQVPTGVVTTPADNLTGVNPGAVTIEWTSDPAATGYYPYLGTAQGLKDAFNFGMRSASTAAVTAYNLAPNTTYWIRLYVIRPNGQPYTDTKFTTGPRLGVVTAPTDGTTGLNPGAVTINWSSDPTATGYYPHIGSAQGLNDISSAGLQSASTTSLTVKNLEPNRTYWIRMWVLRGVAWSYTDTQFTTGARLGIVISPPDNGTSISPGAVAIAWSLDPSATSFYPYLGTAPGLNNVFNFGERSGSSTGVMAYGLVPNTTYWVRLWVNRSGAWSYSDSSFTTGMAGGIVISPDDGAFGMDPSVVQIVWTADPTATVFYPYVGSARGLNDIFNFGEQSSSTTSVTATTLAPNTTYWIRLWVRRANSWSYTDSQFTTVP